MGAQTHQNLSRRLHNLIWGDKDQTICSRAFYRQYVDRRWAIYRVLVDAFFLTFFRERSHCRKSFDRYW